MSWNMEKTRGQESRWKVAALQMEPILGQTDQNLKKSLELIDRAVDQGAKLVVLPELTNSGWNFNSRQEAYETAESIPGGKTVSAWMKRAAEKDIYIVGGVCEREGVDLFNSAVLVGPEGLIGKYRKIHLFDIEQLFFEPGNLGLPVFSTPIGKIGLLICYDLWFPETARILMLQGADIICAPSDWTPAPKGRNWDEKDYCMANYLVMTAAHTNQVFVVGACRVGTDRGLTFLGRSMIAGPSGWPLVGPASGDQEEILITELNIVKPRLSKIWSRLNDYLRDRRTDLYDVNLGYTKKNQDR